MVHATLAYRAYFHKISFTGRKKVRNAHTLTQGRPRQNATKKIKVKWARIHFNFHGQQSHIRSDRNGWLLAHIFACVSFSFVKWYAQKFINRAEEWRRMPVTRHLTMSEANDTRDRKELNIYSVIGSYEHISLKLRRTTSNISHKRANILYWFPFPIWDWSWVFLFKKKKCWSFVIWLCASRTMSFDRFLFALFDSMSTSHLGFEIISSMDLKYGYWFIVDSSTISCSKRQMVFMYL